MTRAHCTFRQADIRRAWAAARKEGKDGVRTEFGPDGRIVLVHKADAPTTADETALQGWEAKHNAHSP
jgi:hypothetical protein